MPKTKTTTIKTSASSDEQLDDRPPLKWTAEEYSPSHHWWWFVVLAIVGLYFTGLFFLAGDWSFASLTFVVTFGLIVFGADKPRVWRYQLDEHVLSVEGQTRVRPIFFEWDLQDFKAVTREQIIRRKGEVPYELLVLIGKRRLAWPRDVYLTGKKATDARILARLAEAVPLDDAPQFQAASRRLQRLGRMLGLA